MGRALKARFMQAEVHQHHTEQFSIDGLNRAFSAWSLFEWNPGAMPQAQNEGAPLALSRHGFTETPDKHLHAS